MAKRTRKVSGRGKRRSAPAVKVRASTAPLPELEHVEDLLRDLIGRAEEPRREGPGKRKVLPTLCLWSALLVGLLRKCDSISDIWRLISVEGVWSYAPVPVTDEAVRKRLAQKGGAEALKGLFEQLTVLLAERLKPYEEELVSFAAEVVAIDQTTLDTVMRHLPELRARKKGDPALLPGRLSGSFDLRRQQWKKLEFTEDSSQNEKVLAREMVEDLAPGSLILFDLGYFAFAFFDWLTNQGYFWISRMREKTSYEIVHVNYQQGDTLDALVWLGAHRADRARHLVRLVQFRHGDKLRRYITNVRDAKQLPLHQIAELYARRWDIEMAIKLVKRELKLYLIWSAKEEVLLQQVWGVLILSQIFQALRKEIAGKAGVDVFDVSMTLMIRMLPRFAAKGLDPVETFVKTGRFGGMIRPARRVVIEVPKIDPAQLCSPPEDLVTERKPRYANRKSGPRGN